MRVCPEQWIDNQMPCVDQIGTQVGLCPKETQYFILNGIRRELSEFDVKWIKENCNLEIEVIS